MMQEKQGAGARKHEVAREAVACVKIAVAETVAWHSS